MIGTLRVFAPAALVTASALLAGCVTHMDKLDAGTPVAEIQQEYGEPTSRCTLPEGGERLIWSRQPHEPYAWGVVVGTDGKTGQVTQLLTDENFWRLSSGYWPAERVQCEFGPPANVRQIGSSAVRQVVWNYRYKNHAGWPSVMTVYMGPDGKTARRHVSTDDPESTANGPGGDGSGD